VAPGQLSYAAQFIAVVADVVPLGQSGTV